MLARMFFIVLLRFLAAPFSLSRVPRRDSLLRRPAPCSCDAARSPPQFTRFMLRCERDDGDAADAAAAGGATATSELAEFVALVNDRASKLRVVDLISRRLNARRSCASST